MHLSPGIDYYIKSLSCINTVVFIMNEPNNEPPSKQHRTPLTTCKSKKLPKGSNWDNPLPLTQSLSEKEPTYSPTITKES